MKNMKAAMKKVERSSADKKMDKKMGIKEGSPKDVKMDMAAAKKMMKQKVSTPRSRLNKAE